MCYNFENKVALITGAAVGIGKSTAQAFARDGATVVVADVLDEEGEKTVNEINKNGGKAIYIHADMGKPDDIKTLFEKIETEYNQLNFAFNNAGVEGQQAVTADSTLDNWEKVININLRGIYLCVKYEIPLMLKNNGGSIVNCSSVAGLVGYPSLPAYVASKHGVVGLTKTAALEYAQQGIRVNTVNPGVINTAMIDRFIEGNPGMEKTMIESEPIGRMGQPNEIAEAVLWLCSDKASFVTGHTMVVDGGFVAQ